MKEQSYEEYIRNILGYPLNDNTCEQNNVYETQQYMPYSYNMESSELEECYPEIYKIIYPMITQACSRNTKPITKDVINTMTDDIYSAIETDTEINININLGNEINNVENRASTSSYKSKNTRATTEQKSSNLNRENRGDNRQFRNNNLRDLIKILLIRELLGRPGFPGSRPPFRPNPRPPFPGGPIGPRPPIIPRGEYENIYDIYEK